MKYVALAVFTALALSHGANAEDIPVLHYSLPNGLEVVLAPDHRVPKVVLNLSYRVGSMNEPPGRSGFAHLFEHLMFAGTPAYPSIDEAYGALGVDLNAWTWEDRTLYYAEGLSSALPFMLAVEADRMANQGAAITQNDLDVQRSVVLNEMRENVLDYVNGAGWEAIRTSLFSPQHPYSRAVIGSMADLGEATLGDVHAFFDTFYSPNNAILVVVGDFEPAEAEALVADTFGRIPAGPSIARPEATSLEPTRARIELEDRTPTPTVALGWTVPGFGSPELGRLRIATELLGNAEYGVLRRRLVDKGLATAAWVWIERAYLGSRFLIEISAAEGADPAAVEMAARDAVAGFIAAPVASADLERARRRILLSDRVGIEPLKARAELIALYTDMLGDPEAALRDDPDTATATAAELEQTIRLLDPADATVLVVRPGERGGYPDVLTRSSGVAAPLPVVNREPVDVPRLTAHRMASASLPEPEHAVLSNGIEVMHYRVAGAPMAYLAAHSPAGTLSAPEGKEGIAELAAMMGPRGAGGLDPDTFGKAVKDLGADIDWKADDLASFLTLAAPPDTIAEAIGLFADALRAPLFDAQEWDVARASMLDDLAAREGDLPDVAARFAEAALFPKMPGEPAIDRSIASVRSITRIEARTFYARMFTPATVSLHSVGPQPIAELVEALERVLGNWQYDVEPLRTTSRRPATFPDQMRVMLVPETGASQAAIHIALPAPGIDEPGHAEAIAVLRLLAYDFISRLNTVVREEKGYSYGTDGELLDAVRMGSLMAVETTVERENTAAALEEMFTGIAGLAADPVRPDEVERTVRAHQVLIAGTWETAAGLFDEIWSQLGRGSTLEEAHRLRLAVTRLELDGVRRQAEAMASLDRAVVVIVGDPGVVMPQLEGIGLDIELMSRESP